MSDVSEDMQVDMEIERMCAELVEEEAAKRVRLYVHDKHGGVMGFRAATPAEILLGVKEASDE